MQPLFPFLFMICHPYIPHYFKQRSFHLYTNKLEEMFLLPMLLLFLLYAPFHDCVQALQNLQEEYSTLWQQYEQLHIKSRQIIATLQEERDQKIAECETLRSQVNILSWVLFKVCDCFIECTVS